MSALNNMIDRFLEDHHKSDGGWAKITMEDIKLLCDIICTLIELKCDPDPDGDFPIEFRVVNRRRYEGLRFSPVPYENEATQYERLRVLAANMTMATDRLRTEIECMKYNSD